MTALRRSAIEAGGTRTTTETRTYAQAAAQTQGKEKEMVSDLLEITTMDTTRLPYRFPFREDLSEYEKEGVKV